MCKIYAFYYNADAEQNKMRHFEFHMPLDVQYKNVWYGNMCDQQYEASLDAGELNRLFFGSMKLSIPRLIQAYYHPGRTQCQWCLSINILGGSSIANSEQLTLQQMYQSYYQSITRPISYGLADNEMIVTRRYFRG